MNKEKQIEQMAKDLKDIDELPLDLIGIATILYEDEGWRKQEWISVDDRLPEIAGKYLISRKTVYGNLINIVWYDTNYNGGNDDMIGKSVWYMFDGDWGDYEIPNVTHWMPLPQPPKMKGGAE